MTATAPAVPPGGEASGAKATVPRRISGAELRVWLAWLGLDAEEAGRVLDVRHDTVRKWLTGKEPVPVRVGKDLERIDDATAMAVDDLVKALGNMRDPAVVVYKSDAELWAARAGVEPCPARWWVMVVARATAEVPGVEIQWA